MSENGEKVQAAAKEVMDVLEEEASEMTIDCEDFHEYEREKKKHKRAIWRMMKAMMFSE